MATFGLTAAGFVPKTLTDIKDELEAAMRAAFGASIDVSATSNFGQLVGIMAERFAELWEVAEADYNSIDPANASGSRLHAIGAITGTLPNDPLSSAANMIATGTPGTVLLATRIASVVVTGVRFATLADATLGAATAWAATHLYSPGDFVTNAGNVYYCNDGGTSAGSGGPSGTGSTIVDGTAGWMFVGGGTGYAVIPAASVDAGAIVALTGTLTNIETPISGWSAVNNVADAVLGRGVETDDVYRARRQNELVGASKSVLDAIRTRLLEDVPGVTTAIVFQNATGTTNGDGMPPHSVEALVVGGNAQAIAEAVYVNVAAGIESYGNQTNTVVDSKNGNQSYPVKWSRPNPINVYVDVTITKIPHDADDPETYPLDGDAQIRDAILTYGASVLPGRDAVAAKLGSLCFKTPGVLDVIVKIGLSASPTTSTTVAIALREQAIYDSSRLTLASADGTP